MNNHIIIIDFGSQYTQLIARKVRESGVYCKVWSCTEVSREKFINFKPKGIILSGGPGSIQKDSTFPQLHQSIIDVNIPILGICYGMQLLADHFGANVQKSEHQEFGRAILNIIDRNNPIFSGLPTDEFVVWMSHGDRVLNTPPWFDIIGKSGDVIAAIFNKERNIFGFQFHPEVVHTQYGQRLLSNFLYNICGCSNTWSMHSFKDYVIEKIKNQVGDKRVICGVSGGIDSTVTAALLHNAIGDNLTCIFVDHGLLRYKESEEVESLFADHFGIPLISAHEESRFLNKLKNIKDPEQKRKIIGNTFVEVFEEHASKLENVDFLAQGTLYPDVIESMPFHGGPSATIKSHHNVGGLPEKMNLKLVEPLRELFKDEVRKLAAELGVPENFIRRHPFPGPGLGIRIMGEITKQQIQVLQKADHIFITELKEAGLYNKVWQAFAVLIPIKTVGVMGDCRTYEDICGLRAVTAVDGMTAEAAKLDPSFISHVSTKIINEVRGINRVVYDYTSKPPGTIEWE